VVELCHLVQALEVSFVFFDTFVKLCEEKGVKPSRALTDAGVPKSAYSYWRTEASFGNDAKPTNQNAVKLAQYFGVTVDYLLTGEQKENPPQQPQSEVDAAVERIRKKLESMPKEQREALMNLIEKM
jgi:transcriptional regulator with XRE-family HTH domain